MSSFLRILGFENKFSDNIFTEKSVLNDNTDFNVTNGTGVSSFFNDNYYGNFAVVTCQSYNTDDFVFNFGDALTVPITRDGSYLFQLSFFDIDPTVEFFVPFEFGVNVYKNGVFDQTITGQMVSNPDLNARKTITFSQNINCVSVTELDFSFVIYPDVTYPHTNTTFNIGNFKLEHNNKFLDDPTPYTLPTDYYTNPYTGWGYYVDSLATPTVVVGTTYTQITIDGLGASITNHLPKEIRGVSQLWAGSKITPISVGDDYDGRFDLTITAKTGSPTAIELIIDISGSTAGTNTAFTSWLQAIGTAPYNQSMPLDFFTLSTFLTNGGKLYAKVDSGTVTIGRRNIKISRKSKAF